MSKATGRRYIEIFVNKKTYANDASARSTNKSSALYDLELWSFDPRSWSFRALALWTTCANSHQNRFSRSQNIIFTSLVTDELTNGQVENIMPPFTSLTWRINPHYQTWSLISSDIRTHALLTVLILYSITVIASFSYHLSLDGAIVTTSTNTGIQVCNNVIDSWRDCRCSCYFQWNRHHCESCDFPCHWNVFNEQPVGLGYIYRT